MNELKQDTASSKEKLVPLYKQMWLIRYFEEKVDEFA